MQRERDYTTIGISLLLVAFAVIGNAYPWISVPLIVLAILFMAWGRERRRVETFVGRMPAGKCLLKGLEKLDLIISPCTDLRYRLFVTAEVQDRLLTGENKLDGKVQIKNTSGDPLQYGPAVFSATFQNDAPKVLNGNKIPPPQAEVYYPFEFDERAMATNHGHVIFTADIDYGPVGSRTRRMHKKIKVEYAVGDGKFIADQKALDLEYDDIAIQG